MDLLPEQKRFLARGLPGRDRWNMSLVLELEDGLGTAHLARALAEVVRRHPALRTRLDVRDVPSLLDASASDVVLEVADLDDCADGEVDSAIEGLADRAHARLSLHSGPLLRLVHVRLGRARPGRLLLVVHHFACDLWSIRLLANELLTLARSYRAGGGGLLAPVTGVDVLGAALEAGLREGRFEADRETWSRLAHPFFGAVGSENPQRQAVVPARSVLADTGPEVALRILSAARASGSSPRAVCLALLSLAVVQSGLSSGGVSWNVLGHGRSGIRGVPSLLRTVGWLVTRFPLSVQVSPTEKVSELVAETTRRLAEVPRNQHTYAMLRGVAPIASGDWAPRTPDVTFNFTSEATAGVLAGSRRGRGTALDALPILAEGVGRTQAPGPRDQLLNIHLHWSPDGVLMICHYISVIHRPEDVQDFLGRFRALAALLP